MQKKSRYKYNSGNPIDWISALQFIPTVYSHLHPRARALDYQDLRLGISGPPIHALELLAVKRSLLFEYFPCDLLHAPKTLFPNSPSSSAKSHATISPIEPTQNPLVH